MNYPSRKAIFWDNDGILVDSEELYYRATRDVLRSVNIEITEDIFINVSLQQGRSVLEIAAEKGLTYQDIDDLRLKRNDLYARLLREEVKPRAGIEHCLQELHGKLAMGVVTASLKQHFDIIHNRTGLRPFFDFVITFEDVKRSKPDPEPYLSAIKKIGLPKERCIVVEDSERGMVSALGAGLACIAVPSSLTVKGDFSRATKVCRTIPELERELLHWLAQP